MPKSQKKPEMKLTITLSGETKSGKSTIAAELAHHLYGLGFNIEWRDPDMEWYRLTQKPEHAEKITKIAKETGLKINVLNVMRPQAAKPVTKLTPKA